jgi:hypothetical protein
MAGKVAMGSQLTVMPLASIRAVHTSSTLCSTSLRLIGVTASRVPCGISWRNSSRWA